MSSPDGLHEEVSVVVVELEQGLELSDPPLDVAGPAAQERLPQVAHRLRELHFMM